VAAVADPGWGVGNGVEDLLDDRSHRGGNLPCPAGGGGACRAGKCAQVLAFSVVELQRVGDTLEHLLRGACQVATLHADVVVDAHTGEQRDLFTAQPFDAPVAAAVGGESGLFGGDPGAAGGEEVADLGLVVHDLHGRPCRLREGGTGITWKARHSLT
jgi:hypothetical protein